MAAFRIFAELTGQSINTVRFMELILKLDDIRVRHEPRQIDPRTVYRVSRVYDYRVMQLVDMAPGSNNVRREPYNGLPAPHLLIGYQYMHKVLNDYYFENRVFMQLGFSRTYGPSQPRLYWTCLTDCSYSVDVGRYMQFLDLDNFNETFEQMHNSVLMDRISADMGNLAGRGDPYQQDIVTTLTGRGAAGLSTDTAVRIASRDDANILSAIRQLRVALTHYLFSWYFDCYENEHQIRFLPFGDVFTRENWLQELVDSYGSVDTRRLVDAVVSRGFSPSDAAEIMSKCLMSTLIETQNPAAEGPLRGGAIQLRNRRVPSREGLRPRGPRGRAITTSQLSRRRRRTAQVFVDRLPQRRRRRTAAAAEQPPAEMEEDQYEPEPGEVVADEEEDFLDEVFRTVLAAINALRDELSPASRRHQMFQFGNDFYRLLVTSRDGGIVTDSFLRKWVLYFFLSEHVASTLYYLYVKFMMNRNFTRFVTIETLQVLLTGWDVHARQVFKRIWSEQNAPNMFEALWSRVLLDFLMMVERTGQFAGMDEADQQLFLSDIQYRDKSGDIDDVLNQLNLSEELIESIDISFRIKFKGVTAISTNQRIQARLREVNL
ncbi:pTP [Duck adenovirus 3]|uniref:PTP n=2 Tax=Duck aviadenovirus B TaxID=1534553 RepID=A0A0N9E648_9ADEN|nr:pTP [Duck adenovirus 2]UIY90312.1 pTP [Duck adenovirus 3]UIY90347.1 pTP [Duck adenovirus 3]UIY90379.1 pTP [Duck adenovirus 3]UIY90408.1 pTP [Duck adenovirus 3]